MQMIEDYEDYAAVNVELDKMGFNMGTRLIEEFLARTPNMNRCQSFEDVGHVLAKVGFKTFLNTTPLLVLPPAQPNPAPGTVHPDQPQPEFTLVLHENPLADFVQIPEAALEGGLWFSNVLCGVIRGALEMVGSRYTLSAHRFKFKFRRNLYQMSCERTRRRRSR